MWPWQASAGGDRPRVYSASLGARRVRVTSKSAGGGDDSDDDVGIGGDDDDDDEDEDSFDAKMRMMEVRPTRVWARFVLALASAFCISVEG